MKTQRELKREIEEKKKYLRERHGSQEHWVAEGIPLEMENAFLDSIIRVEDQMAAEKN